MLSALIVVLRSIGLICRGRRAVALENVALQSAAVAEGECVSGNGSSVNQREERLLMPAIVSAIKYSPGSNQKMLDIEILGDVVYLDSRRGSHLDRFALEWAEPNLRTRRFLFM